jgi:hypothetical protein
MTAAFVRRTALAVSTVTLLTAPLRAQAPVAATLTPFAGYLVTGNWYDGPIGTSLKNSNQPIGGVQGSVPLTSTIALIGNLAYASGDLRIGLPVFGGVNVGSTKTWLYDAGLEIGGLGNSATGIKPFVQGGIGGMTNDIQASVLNTRATNVAYSAAVGIDIGVSKGFALRAQAKDWMSRFNSEQAVGFRADGNLAHNWALTAGMKLSF